MGKEKRWYDYRWEEGLELYGCYLKRSGIDSDLEEELRLDTDVDIVAGRLGLHSFIKGS